MRLAMSSIIAAASAAFTFAVAITAAPPSAHAVTYAYTITGVFNDGGSLSGSFTYDEPTQLPAAFDLTSTNGSSLSGYHYDLSNSDLSCIKSSPCLSIVSGSRYMDLDFNNDFPPSFLGTLFFTGSEQSDSGRRNVEGAFTPVSSTPLPAALPLFATGLGALGLLGWRTKRTARSVAA
jgi:hypothetical protein